MISCIENSLFLYRKLPQSRSQVRKPAYGKALWVLQHVCPVASCSFLPRRRLCRISPMGCSQTYKLITAVTGIQ